MPNSEPQQNQTPEPFEYARARKATSRVEDPKAPAAFVWLFLISSAVMVVSIWFTNSSSGAGTFERRLIEIFYWLDVAAIVVMNGLALWAYVLVRFDRRYLQSTIVILGLLISASLALAGDVFIVIENILPK